MKEHILKAAKEGDWEVYRKYFPRLSIENRIELYSTWDGWFPCQAHFSDSFIAKLFTDAKLILEELKVVELGCHQGYLAKKMLNQFDIKSWIGYDINKSAIKRSVVEDKKYTAIPLINWFYETNLPNFNIFISTHTFEHMYLEEIEKTLELVSQCAEYIILEIPILENGQDWKNYGGSHVLTSGRQVIRDLITACGFTQTMDSQTANWVTGWKKEG